MQKSLILIHAHDNIRRLNRLIKELAGPEFEIYVNADLKADFKTSELAEAAQVIRERINVHWGGFSQVQAILNSFEQILNEQKNFTHIVYLSGADFPVKDNHSIHSFLNANTEREFLSWQQIGKEHWNCAERFEYYQYKEGNLGKRIKASLFSRIQKLTGKKRLFPEGMTPYGGPGWFMLSKNAVQYILEFFRKRPQLRSFLEFSACSDEIVFQSILLNSDFKSRIENAIYRYVDWGDGQRSNPRELSIKDYEKIIASSAFFCRKIGSDKKADDLCDALSYHRKALTHAKQNA